MSPQVCAACILRVFPDAAKDLASCQTEHGRELTEPPRCQLCLGILQYIDQPCEASAVPAKAPKGCTLLGPGTWFQCNSLCDASLLSVIEQSGHTLDNISIHVQVRSSFCAHVLIPATGAACAACLQGPLGQNQYGMSVVSCIGPAVADLDQNVHSRVVVQSQVFRVSEFWWEQCPAELSIRHSLKVVPGLLSVTQETMNCR